MAKFGSRTLMVSYAADDSKAEAVVAGAKSWTFSKSFLSDISTRRSSGSSRYRANSVVRGARSSGSPAESLLRLAFCMGYAKRTSLSLSFPGIFGDAVCRCRRFLLKICPGAAYLEEDLGDTTLFEFLSKNRAGDNIAAPAIEAYREVVNLLPRFQIEAGRDLNYKLCYPRASFDRQSIAWDSSYFKCYFLKLAGIPFNEQALEVDFGRLTRFLLSADRWNRASPDLAPGEPERAPSHGQECPS